MSFHPLHPAASTMGGTMEKPFTARIAPHFAGSNEPLYEVVTSDGRERIASTTSEMYAAELAHDLSDTLLKWAARVGSDAVIS
jgi:hypothetical protein